MCRAYPSCTAARTSAAIVDAGESVSLCSSQSASACKAREQRPRRETAHKREKERERERQRGNSKERERQVKTASGCNWSPSPQRRPPRPPPATARPLRQSAAARVSLIAATAAAAAAPPRRPPGLGTRQGTPTVFVQNASEFVLRCFAAVSSSPPACRADSASSLARRRPHRQLHTQSARAPKHPKQWCGWRRQRPKADGKKRERERAKEKRDLFSLFEFFLSLLFLLSLPL